MRLALVLLAAALAGIASAQVTFFRIPVRHADPWAIKMMMEGRPITSPEISTTLLLSGGNGLAALGAAAATQNLLAGGRLFVNPTDNSLWWVGGETKKP